MNRNRFDFALERLGSGDWKTFEDLASTFLATEFPNIRTMASPSGDRGRDAELYSPADDPSIVFQYSVTMDWNDKIRRTARKVSEEFDEPAMLVYVTNQIIGAQADDLKRDIWKQYKLGLDIRDRTWFLDRFGADQYLASVAEALAQEVVNPYLESQEVIASKAQALTDVESRAAFVFLGFQLEDDTREKGLTRLSFEALVRAVLRGTNKDKRLPRTEVHRRVNAMLPNHPTQVVEQHTDKALLRLTKKVIRHKQAPDEFSLTFEESQRIENRLVDTEKADREMTSEIYEVIQHELPDISPQSAINIAPRVRRIIEQFLLSQGEHFASAVQKDRYEAMPSADPTNHIINDLGTNPLAESGQGFDPRRIADIIAHVLTNPGIELRRHLRSLADAYTLLAFLRETADVQRAMNKMFSYGNIWLDTNIVLPLLAELLVPEDHRKFSAMIKAATEAGLDLHVTPGVLEETVGHMNLSLSYARTSAADWEGTVPFLYSVFVQSGRSPHDFPRWIEEFRGDARPQDDVADYLREFFEIKVTSLEEDARAVPQNLRLAVQEVWQSAHERRRQGARRVSDPMLATRLANHDVENYLGVLNRRRNETKAPVGYSSWWLTLDRTAYTVERNLRTNHNLRIATPIMSADFLMSYLALGPVRSRVSRQSEELLPIVLDLGKTDALPPELIEVANSVREQFKDLPEHIIRRKVRDALDAAKAQLGEVAAGGLQEIENELIQTSRA